MSALSWTVLLRGPNRSCLFTLVGRMDTGLLHEATIDQDAVAEDLSASNLRRLV